MITWRSAVALRTACLALLLGVMSPNLEAAFGTDFLDALDEMEAGDYREAIENLESAIRDKEDEGINVRFYGMIYGNYIPYFYLGQAKFQLGDCEGAMAAWDTSMRQGVIQDLPEFEILQAGLNACGAQVIDVEKLAQDIRQELGRLEGRVEQLAGIEQDFERLGDQQYQSGWVQQWKPEVEQWQRTLTDLDGRVSAGLRDKDAERLQAVQAQIAGLDSELVGAATQAANQVAAIEQDMATRAEEARKQARRALTMAVAEARAAERIDGGASVSETWSSLVTLADSADRLPAGAPVSQQSQMVQDLNSALRRYRVAVQSWQQDQARREDAIPPAELREIAVHYFSGNYDNAILLADPASFSKDREKIQALLFRAAARYRVYHLSGENRSDDLLRRAEEDIRSIKSLNSRFTPYIPAFSPKFLDFFRQSG